MLARKLLLPLIVITLTALNGCATTPHEPEMTEAERQSAIEVLLAEADKDASTGNHSVALLRYEEVLDLDSNNLAALLGAGSVTYAMERYDSSLDFFNRALEIEPESVDALEGKGLTELKRRQFKSAGDLLGRVVEQDSSRWRAFNALGVMADLDADYELAQSHYRKALALKKDHAQLLNNLGYSLIMSHDYPDAEKVLEQAHALEPAFFRATNNYAIAIAWQKRYPEAVEVLAGTVPHEVAYNNVGYIAYLAGDLDSARFYLKKAISASPSYYPEAAANLDKVEKALVKQKRQGSLP